MAGWHLYLIRCANGALYTGITTDVERRLAEHQSGQGARFLRGKGPLRLVFQTPMANRSIASRYEAKVKALPKASKELLAAGKVTLESIFADPEMDPGE